MALLLDTTGNSSSNLITGELISTDVLYANVYNTIYLKNGPFFEGNLKLNYTSKAGVQRTLIMGEDFVLKYLLPNILGNNSNEVYGGITIINTTLDGYIYVDYQALGGTWRFEIAEINKYLINNYLNPVTHFAALVPSTNVYPSRSAADLTSFTKIDATLQIFGKVRLGIAYKPLSYLTNYNANTGGTAGGGASPSTGTGVAAGGTATGSSGGTGAGTGTTTGSTTQIREFQFTNLDNLLTWVVDHNMNTRVVDGISVYDTTGRKHIPGVKIDSLNRFTLYFTSPISGSVVATFLTPAS